MKPSDELFNLIKNLTPAEKRFFRLQSQLQSGEKNYLHLFNAIDKEDEYDEELIKKKLFRARLVKDFSSEKNYLTALILKSLRIFHENSSDSIMLNNLQSEIEVTFQKGLYSLCAKLIKKLKTKALEQENFLVLLQAYSWEHRIRQTKTLTVSDTQNIIEKNIKEELNYAEKIIQIIKMKAISARLSFARLTTGLPRTQEDFEKYAQFINDPLLQIKKDSPFWLKIYYYSIYGLYYNIIENLEEAYKVRKKSVELVEKNLSKVDLRLYIATLINFLSILKKESEYYNEFEVYLLKLKSLSGKNNIEMVMLSNAWTLEISKCIENKEFERAFSLIKPIEKNHHQFKAIYPLEHLIIDYYQFFYIHFIRAEYSRSLFWLNKILNLKEEKRIRQDIRSFSEIVKLVVHYELENYELLPYITKSTYRYFAKIKKTYRFETAFLSAVKKLCKMSDKNELLIILLQLKQELLQISEDPLEKNVLKQFDFISWIDSKISGKGFYEVINEAH